MTKLDVQIEDAIDKNLDRLCAQKGEDKNKIIRNLIVDHLDRNTADNLSNRIKDAEFKSLCGLIDEKELG